MSDRSLEHRAKGQQDSPRIQKKHVQVQTNNSNFLVIRLVADQTKQLHTVSSMSVTYQATIGSYAIKDAPRIQLGFAYPGAAVEDYTLIQRD